ncbi:MAG: YhcH/YjgK/YiaL family protein [Prevotellaceae bacterium]|nr:YhcH/YjgK/YiaL family protein [Prevotellaceae bacterium]
MIVDTLDMLSRYAALNPLLKDVVEYLESHDLNAMKEGKYEIKGQDLFLNITTAEAKTADTAVMETHDVMLDIQIPLSVAETYGYTPRRYLPAAEYDEAKDCSKIANLKADDFVTCRPGMFAIFFPQDGHAPCISDEEGIRKAIFKVKNI